MMIWKSLTANARGSTLECVADWLAKRRPAADKAGEPSGESSASEIPNQPPLMRQLFFRYWPR